MNKEFNQNTRTLIVSFVFAIMALIPLRFIEAGQEFSNAAVLGDSIINTSVEIKEESELEAPYNEIESGTYISDDCVSNVDGQTIIDQLTKKIESTKLSYDEIEGVIGEIKEINSRICK
ncbi:MAG TPA: hypothetical protein PK370_00705 [Candidatus Woesebacteria bacterium]|nr:hypothetical protein [Candidatus Woesebacteria bacterium]